MEDPSFANSQQLCALPSDVLRLILAKISLKDRLRLELLSKSHRDALREPEVWTEINLRAMQALELSEEQLFHHLLSRIVPGLQKVLPQIKVMAEVLQDIGLGCHKEEGGSSSDEDIPDRMSAGWFYIGKDELSKAVHSFKHLHEKVPESWVLSRSTLKACTAWLWTQFVRIPQLPTVCLDVLQKPSLFSKKLEASLGVPLARHEAKGSVKLSVSLDVSGAANLSPFFLSASIVAFSEAGVKVDFKMNGENDPSFPFNVLVILQSLALDCSIHVPLLVSGETASLNFRSFLKKFSSREEQHEEGVVASVIASSCFPVFGDLLLTVYYNLFKHDILDEISEEHKLLFQKAERDSLSQISLLVHFRKAMQAFFGQSPSCGAKAKLTSQTVVIEDLLTISGGLLQELREYCTVEPSKLRLVFLNSVWDNIDAGDVRALGDVLGACGVGFVTFRQLNVPAWREGRFSTAALLTSAELRQSGELKAVEFDCALDPTDIDAIGDFLDGSKRGAEYRRTGKEIEQAGAEVIIHLRKALYSREPQVAKLVFSKLTELGGSERGSRMKLVHYRGRSRLPTTTGGQRSENIFPVQQEIESQIWVDEKLLWFVDKLVFLILVGYIVLCVGALFDLSLFRYPVDWAGHINSSYFGFAKQLWGAVRATIRGKRDWVGIGIGLVFIHFGSPLLWLALKLLFWYMCACFAWTVLRLLGSRWLPKF